MTIQLFITCLIDSVFPEVGEAVVHVLQRAGENVDFPPDQTCCGQPAFNAGFTTQARLMAQHTIDALSQSKDPVVIPSGSCADMIRHRYAELFAEDKSWLPRSQELASRCFELSEFLVDRLGITEWDQCYPRRLAYHPSCHTLRGLGVDTQPKTLLKSIRGAEVQFLPEDCCGFGGVFSVENEAISGQLLRRRLQQIEASGSEVVVACDVSCLMNIEGGLRKVGSAVRCAHLAQILAGREVGLR